MTVTIDGPMAIDLIDQAVKMRGSDYVAPTLPHPNFNTPVPHYWDKANNVPCCIVGAALFIAGVPAGTIAALDWTGIISARHIPEETGGTVQLSEDAKDVFDAAQSEQDDGMNWGAAQKNAESAYQRARNV